MDYEDSRRGSFGPPVNLDRFLFTPGNEKMQSLMHCSDFKQREMRGELAPEPLLTEDKTRFVLFPIKHHDVSLVNQTCA